jgi:hypothetical protein
MTVKKFEDIKSWQIARELAGTVYKLECINGKSIDLAIRDQIQRE